MWIFLAGSGFFSVVAARHLDQPGRPIDESRVVVRARDLAHLRRLCDRHRDLLGPSVQPTSSRLSDYAHRAVIATAIWASILHREASSIRYGNHKSEVERVHGPASAYARACHEVWHVMLALQRPIVRGVDEHNPQDGDGVDDLDAEL